MRALASLKWTMAAVMITVAGLLCASSASATTVERDQAGLSVKAAGEDNWYKIDHIPRHPTYCPRSPRGCFTVNDYNPNPMVDGRGCFIASPTPAIIRCKDPGGRVPITVKAGDLNDTIVGLDASEPRPDKIFGRIFLGSGNDGGHGGPGDDRIYGG
ncbi:MAG: hypothetical protein M3P84_07510, partial [Chloroflexota bacterium]|nr:hypothetical protein [Chloroflexota bacterium]